MPVLAFDMDGTLTPPKQPIDSEMAKAISYLSDRYTVWIVTGASRDACDAQLGDLVQQIDRIYCCSATEAWEQRRLIYSEKIWIPDGFFEFVKQLEFQGVTHHAYNGMHTLHFPEQYAPDTARSHVVSRICSQFPTLQAHMAGRRSVDILQRDAGKHTVIDDVTSPIWYWGDECDPGGNDYSIAERLQIGAGNRVFRVSNWQDTLHQLKEMFDV
jgi:HAD superfamily hydrolase (TIGR01484 family)